MRVSECVLGGVMMRCVVLRESREDDVDSDNVQ